MTPTEVLLVGLVVLVANLIAVALVALVVYQVVLPRARRLLFEAVMPAQGLGADNSGSRAVDDLGLGADLGSSSTSDEPLMEHGPQSLDPERDDG